MSDQILVAAEAVSQGLASAIWQISTLGVVGTDEQPNLGTSTRKLPPRALPSSSAGLPVEALRQRARPHSENDSTGRETSHTNNEAPDKRKQYGESAREGHKPTAKASYPTPSPMARMRGTSSQETLAIVEENSPASTPVRKTLEEVKAEKQRKWRTKMKMAQEKQRKERRSLRRRRSRRVTTPSNQLATLVGTTVLELIGQCGAVDDASSESDDSGGEESFNSSDSPNERGDHDDSSPARSLHSNEGILEVTAPDRQSMDQDGAIITPPGYPQSQDSELQGSPASLSTSPVARDSKDAQVQNGQNQSADTPWEAPKEFTSAGIDPRSREFIQAFISDITHGCTRLLWHKDKDAISPETIFLRVDMGRKTTDGFFSTPSLSWLEEGVGVFGINLFDVYSLERPSPSDLKDYPFAMPSRTICLRASRDLCYMFETSSENEAYRLVHGLRWLIARLSFNLVIGNVEVASEVLHVGAKGPHGTKVHLSLIEEARRARAMDDLSDQLIESLVFRRQQ